jgi:hypothetical protein
MTKSTPSSRAISVSGRADRRYDSVEVREITRSAADLDRSVISASCSPAAK